MKTTIAIEGIDCYAFHGCLEEEAKIGGRYRVDVLIEKDVEKSVWSDKLEDTVDYVLVNNIVKEQMALRSKLIEHVGGRILSALAVSITGKKTIELKIIKFNPPVNGAVDRTYVILKEDYI
jgi:7,8-dihydroneopterin aldolase/epimerase/oxygenase